jgi:hypothetical protein
MEADLIRIRNDHSLVPECRDWPVNDFVREVWSGSAVIQRAPPAVVNQTPIVFCIKVSPYKGERLERCEIPSCDRDSFPRRLDRNPG